MAYLTLPQLVRVNLTLPVADERVGADTFTEKLMRARILDPERALYGLNKRDRGAVGVDLSSMTGLLTVTLNDITDARTTYAWRYCYYLWPDPPAVYVNGTAVSTGWVFCRDAMQVEFASARPPGATVQLKGHIVDLNQATAEIGQIVLDQYRQLADIKGGEFERIARDFARTVAHYKNRVIRRGES